MAESHFTMFDPAVWETFVRPGEVIEVRIPKASGKSAAVSGMAATIWQIGLKREE